MLAKVFYSGQLVVDGKDNGQVLTHSDLILNEENRVQEVLLKVKNPINDYLDFFYIKLIFTEFLPIKKIYNKKFSKRFKVSLTTEFGTYTFSSDEEAYHEDNFFVGILFTSNPEYIASMIEANFFSKKFILIPRSVSPNEELNFLLRVEFIDGSKNFFRKTYPEMDIYYRSFSRGYYEILSREYPLLGVLIQPTTPTPVLSLEFLNGETWGAKEYFFSLYPLNGVRFNSTNYSFDSYYHRINDKFLNYIATKSSNLVGTKFRAHFTYSNLDNTYVVDISTHHEETTIWQYVVDLIYLTLIEISKPLTINSGFIPTTLQLISEKVSSTYVYLLNQLSDASLPTYEVIKDDGTFSSSSRVLLNREKYDLYVLLFSWAKIYSSFLKKMHSLGYITETEEISNLDNITNDNDKISIFLSTYKNHTSFRFTDRAESNDLTIAALLPIYSYILNFEGRNIYFYPLEETFEFSASLFFEVAKYLTVSHATTEMDVNNYSQFTTTSSFSNIYSEILKQKLLVYTLLDTAYSYQLQSLNTSFFDYAMCDVEEFCVNGKIGRRIFEDVINVDDDIVNIFNSYVEVNSCNDLDQQIVFFVKNKNACTSIDSIYQNIDVEFFNLWSFLQNINYKINPTVLQAKIVFGMH
jgi:hypothetical protein